MFHFELKSILSGIKKNVFIKKNNFSFLRINFYYLLLITSHYLLLILNAGDTSQ